MPAGGGFTSGDDFVAARVSIDIDNQGVQTLKELSNALNNYRTVVEASGRSTDNFVKYLQQMQQTAQQVAAAHQQLASSLETTTSMQGRNMGSGGGPAAELPLSRQAPTAYADPFSGTGGAGMGGQRAPAAADVAAQMQQQHIDPMRAGDPYAYSQAQFGRARTGPTGAMMPTTATGAPDWGEYANRVDAREKAQQAQSGVSELGKGVLAGVGEAAGLGAGIGSFKRPGLASNMANEMSPGGTPANKLAAMARTMGMGAMAGDGTAAGGTGSVGGTALGQTRPASGAGPGNSGNDSANEQSGLAGAIGGMLGKSLGSMGGGALEGLGLGKLLPLLGKLGPLAGVLGVGAAGLGAVEWGGAKYQGLKDLGLIQGGGAMQGFGEEMRIRELGLDPRLSNQQAREAVMSGMTEGYHGEDLTKFINLATNNLKEFNLQISDTVKMMRTGILGGATQDQAGQQIASTMQTLKTLSKNGVISLPDMQKQVGALEQGFEGAGMTSDMALKDATLGEQMWNTPETRALAGDFGKTEQSFLSSTGGQMGLQILSGDVTPGLMPQAMALYNSRHGISEAQETDKALKKLIGKYFRTPESRDKGSIAWANAVAMIQQQLKIFAPGSPLAQDINKTADAVDAIVFSGKDYMAQAKSDVGDATTDGGPQTSSGLGTPSFGSDRSAAISSQYGGGTTVGGAGADQNFSRPQELTPRSTSQAATTPHGSSTGGGGGGVQHNVNFAPAQVTISFGANGQLTASPNPVQLTPNQQAVNSGVGSTTLNNPPPGDGYGYYTGRYGFGSGGGGAQ